MMKITFSVLSRAPYRCSMMGAMRSFRSSPSWWNSDIGNDGDVEIDARELMRRHLHSIKVNIFKDLIFDASQTSSHSSWSAFDVHPMHLGWEVNLPVLRRR